MEFYGWLDKVFQEIEFFLGLDERRKDFAEDAYNPAWGARNCLGDVMKKHV